MLSPDSEYIKKLIWEQSQMADEIAFWAYQAKFYYAACNGIDLEKNWKKIEAVFEAAQQVENTERFSRVDPAHNVGS